MRFGEFELDLSTRELWTNGTKQTLAPQSFQALQLLIESRGQLVTRDALVKHLWPSDTFVDYEQGLKKAVKRLREALNDSAEQPRFIETLPRQGYRFIGEVEVDTVGRDRPAEPIVFTPHLVTQEPKQGHAIRPPISNSRVLWVIAVVICAAIFLFWKVRVSRGVLPTPREQKLTQLTANSFEDPVTSSAISPDGEYLAFIDNEMKMRVRLLDTGETQTISQPESINNLPVDWSIAGWFPNSTRFIANVRKRDDLTMFPDRYRFLVNYRPDGPIENPANRPASVWIISVLGKTAQKLRDGAYAYSVSPDASWIAFGTNTGPLGDREIWLMDPRGQQARKLFDAPESSAIGGFSWSQDGRRAVYFQFNTSDGSLVSRDLQGGTAVPVVRFPDWTSLTDFVWLRNGRLIYANGCNFWALRLDPRSGKAIDQPSQLTNWSESCVGGLSETSDASRLVFQRWKRLTTTYVADLDANGVLSTSAHRFILNEHSNWAEAWTIDSKAVVYRSIRNGHVKLFKQALASDVEEPLVMGAENVAGSAVSPDGAWLYYMDCGLQAEAACEGIVPIMAIPTAGGQPHEVTRSNTYLRPRCPLAPGKYCIVAEQSDEGKPVTFTGFDSRGRGPVLATFPTEPGAQYNWAVSSDGTRIAVFKVWDSRIYVIHLNGEPPQVVTVRPDARLVLISWAFDDSGWFTATKDRSGVKLLHVDLNGMASPLWDFEDGTLAYAVPSPDGHHLTIVATGRSNNVWLMENF
jgi:DNA-binding winged helix-turn-helix (wHTH) protein/Tol biopolymer transport system component